MRVVVADASSLILLAKIRLLASYAARVTLVVPRVVLDECARPELVERHPDAAVIAAASRDRVLHVRDAPAERELPLALGRGEADVVRLFLSGEGDLVLSDDGRAIRTCRLLTIPYTSTPRVVVDLCRAEALDRGQARRALELLGTVGRYGLDVIGSALAMLAEE